MKYEHLHLAIRELHGDLRRPALWIALCGVGVVLAMAGAFGTSQILRPVPLGLYWVTVVALTYIAGALTVNTLRRSLSQYARAVRIGLAGLAAGIVVTGIVAGVNTALFGADWAEGQAGVRFALSTIATAIVVTAVLDYAFTAVRTKPDGEKVPQLLSRLPVEKRGALVSLTALDHYVEVTTTSGTELVLIRLADAIAETAPARGLQIHRSHWVALEHVTNVTPGAGKATAHLSDGRELPVSRKNVAPLRELGLVSA